MVSLSETATIVNYYCVFISLMKMLVQAGAEVNILSSKIQVSLPDEDRAVVTMHMTALMLAA